MSIASQDVRNLADWQKGLDRINNTIVQQVAKNRQLERANTKVIGMYHQQKGVALGMVYDLSLLGGAFKQVKRVLTNFFTAPYFKALAMLSPIKIAKGIVDYLLPTRAAKRLRAGIPPTARAGLAPVVGAERIISPFGGAGGEFPGLGATRIQIGETVTFLTNAFSNLENTMQEVGLETQNLAAAFPLPAELTGQLSEGLENLSAPFNTFNNFLAEQATLFETLEARKAEPEMFETGMAQEVAGADIFQQFGADAEAALANTPLDSGTWSKMKKPAQFFNKQVMKPLKQVAGAGIGLGFQTMFIMGLMQAFSGLFAVFQPVIDVVSILVSMVGTAFMPIVEALLGALTSPTMMSLIDQLTAALFTLMTAIAPLFPVIITLIQIALIPFIIGLQLLAAIIQPFVPYIQMLSPLLEKLNPYIAELMKYVKLLSDAISIGIKWLIDFIKLLFGASPGLIPAFMVLKEIGDKLIAAFFGPIFAAFEFLFVLGNKVIAVMFEPLYFIFNLLYEAGNKIISVFMRVIRVIASMGSVVMGVISGITSFLRFLKSIADSVLGMLGGGGGGGGGFFGFLGFQGGGFVQGPTAAVVGEKEPEFIFTQDQAVALAGLGVGERGGPGQHITINIDGGIWVEDLDSFINMIAKKLHLARLG